MKKYKSISYQNVEITDGFWKNRQTLNADITSRNVYNRFSQSHRFEALNCNWNQTMNYTPHIFWDSDVAKWIEGVAYIINKNHDPELERLCENAIDMIIKNQTEEGYFNSFYLVMHQAERFKYRDNHELYCAGHLIEAACAYYQATGKERFLKAMCKFADYIYDVFYVYQTASFTTCGHPEIELALVRLYKVTGNDKYLVLSKYFLDQRGNNPKDNSGNISYAQDHLPLKKQRTAEGHCVRAMYLCSAMADVAAKYDDEEYKEVCQAIFEDVINYKMYITGGIGSTKIGEAFASNYFLPNDVAYTETCAAIALALFCKRMQYITVDSRFADTIERIIYNGFLSGVSLDGKAFFYENPLEIDPFFADVDTCTSGKRHMPIMERVEIFTVSCCPPNILRFIASIGEFLYTYDADTLFVHQFMNSESTVEKALVRQITGYPADGCVKISVKGGNFSQVAVRIPGWCTSFTANKEYVLENGYAYFKGVDEIQINFDMKVQFYEAGAYLQNNAGCVAVTRGPVVYCMEEIDNGKHLRSLMLKNDCSFEIIENTEYNIPTLKTKGLRKVGKENLYQLYDPSFEEVDLQLIPYFAFANRGVSEMIVWVRVCERNC